MSDKKKDSTPPPLLLMQPAGGLTLTPASGSGLLMPVPSNESALMTAEDDLEGEADSFVGQSPSQQAPFPYFQSPAAGGSSVVPDPFAQVSQPDLSAASGPIRPPAPLPSFPSSPAVSASHSAPSVAPPRGVSHNMYRMSGPRMYAQPPAGTYAHSAAAPLTSSSPFQAPSPASFQNSPAPPASSFAGSLPPSTFGGQPPTSFSVAPTTSSFGGAPPTSYAPYSSQTVNMDFGAPSIPSTAAPPTSLGMPPPTTMGMASDTIGSPQSVMVPGALYAPVQYHWFYSKHMELRTIWQPFSMTDSMQLEEAFNSGHQDNVVLSVEGGRYDVDVFERTRSAIYWEEELTQVRRCSWFYRPEGDTRFAPYEEDFADRLESEYRNALENQLWHKPLEFPSGETIVMHSPNVIVQFQATSKPDEWGTAQGDQMRPRVVKRGIDDFESIEAGEPMQVDHVVFVVHGIGSTCDLRFRNIVECVDDFRSISLQILRSHFGHHQSDGRIGRVEFLPVRWHAALHGDATGVDKRLKAITLNSISKLRHFTNDTLLDILFYASPAYCQQIADTVGSEINRLNTLFLSRNPSFKGQMSVAGHSLGSLIMFDLLSHQGDSDITPVPSSSPVSDHGKSESRESTPNIEDVNGTSAEEVTSEDGEEIGTLQQLLNKLSLSDYVEQFEKEHIDLESLGMCEDSDMKEMGIPLGPRKKLQGYLKEQKQKQARRKINEERRAKAEAAKQVQREAERLAQEQAQQITQMQVANHPTLRQASSTSVDYLVSGNGIGSPLVKYPKLQFEPAHFFALGSPIAMFLTVRGVSSLGEEFKFPTCPGFYNIFHPFDPVAYRIEPLISPVFPPKPVLMPHHKGRKRLHLELRENIARMGTEIKQRIMDSVRSTWKSLNDFAQSHWQSPQDVEREVEEVLSGMSAGNEDDKFETGSIASSMFEEEEIPIGQLNHGRRVDYVLQEKPIESFNDYLFALGSHACYWESEDTVLMIMKEIYALHGIVPQRPGQNTAFPRPPVPTFSPAHTPSGGSIPPPGGSSGPYNMNILPQQSASGSPLIGVSQSSMVNPGPVNVGPPPTAMGPPPMSGFTKQTPK